MTLVDVIGFGAVAVDDLVVVDRYPEEDTKVETKAMERQPGGLTGTALVAAARMGGRCAYAGTLGDDELSRFVFDSLSAEGIDVTPVIIEPDRRPYHSIIVVGAEHRSRTILYSSDGVVGAHPLRPDGDILRGCKVVLLDDAGIEGMRRFATAAREMQIPRVGDFERGESAELLHLMRLTNHLILPLDYALRVTRTGGPTEAINELWHAESELVAVTNGDEGCWYRSLELGRAVRHQNAFAVEVVDTTGCGDVFHGVYAYCLAKKRPANERIAMASAAAALKATRQGGQSGIPFMDEIERFRSRFR